MAPELCFDRSRWPPFTKYPLNTSESRVLDQVWPELEAGPCLVVTGFTSLEYLVRHLSRLKHSQVTRVLMGQEPDLPDRPTRSFESGQTGLDEEMKGWWLERGFSILSGVAVLRVLDRLDQGLVEFRLLDQLHAKMVVGQNAAILGSSNFSRAGMEQLLEANIRKHRQSTEYDAIQRVAEEYWGMAEPANEKIRSLLLQLLQRTTWQEALWIAGRWTLDGNWLQSIPSLAQRLARLPLWESQRQALAQSLYLLDNSTDGLLVADPTGSGKTRLGAALHALLLLRLHTSGQAIRTRTVIVTPPQVVPTWEEEFLCLDSDRPGVMSQGLLSRNDHEEHRNLLEKLRGARLLFLDEAHNFLNPRSNRSVALHGHGADHVVLFTATPINRSQEDLFRIVNLLGPDNLSDEALETFDRWLHRGRQRGMDASDYTILRDQVSSFTVRRTKADLNNLIERNPQGYTRKIRIQDQEREVPCRYPRPSSSTYRLNETERDVRLAREIDREANNLRGLIYLRTLHATEADLETEENQRRFLERRLKAAAALAAWNVKATLRSSRAALVEHLLGSQVAADWAGVDLPHKATGDIVGGLKRKGFPLPRHRLTIPLLDWMTDESLRARALEEEIATYERIAALAREVSDSRERSRARLLADLSSRHERVVAFDSRVVTLAIMRKLLVELAPGVEVLVVTGNQGFRKREASKVFGLNSTASGRIGLFSDVMSEGVNLQGASCLVLLDMPSVMRQAEQRIGRIDRMNSPYEEIEIWWPEDHESFALRTDKKFFLTADSVRRILGSNIEVPNHLTDALDVQPITGTTAKDLWEKNARESERRGIESLTDAFADFRALFEGEVALVSKDVRRHLKAALPKTVYAVVAAEKPWALLVTDEGANAPRWILWTEGSVTTHLGKIARFLREALPRDEPTNDFAIDDEDIQRVLRDVERKEIDLLPNKKRRSLRTLARLIEYWAREEKLPKRFRNELLRWAQVVNPPGGLFSSSSEDQARHHHEALARAWLGWAEPQMRLLREQWRKKRFLSWKSKEVFQWFQERCPDEDDWESLLRTVQPIEPLERRLRVAVWGIRPKRL